MCPTKRATWGGLELPRKLGTFKYCKMFACGKTGEQVVCPELWFTEFTEPCPLVVSGYKVELLKGACN